MRPEPDSDREPRTSSDEDPLAELPTSLVPRWLAAVVLLALVAAGVVTAWLVIWG